MYVPGEELLQSLHLTLIGISSSVYVWDSDSEQFTLRVVPQGMKGRLVLVGTDEVISERSVRGAAARCMRTNIAQYCGAFLEYRHNNATSGDTGPRT